MSREAISAGKLRGLRERLEAVGSVQFKNGAEVTLEQSEHRAVGEESPTVVPYVEVTRPQAPGGVSRFGFDDDGLRAAYTHALYGPKPHPQPSGDGSKFGEDPPF